MALNKQIHIYSVDTSAFYHENELKTHKTLNRMYVHKSELIKLKKKCKTPDETKIIIRHIKFTNKIIKNAKEKLYNKFKESTGIRALDESYLVKKNVVSVFDSTLTRTVRIPQDSLNKDIMIVQTYFFEVIEDIIIDGFIYNSEKYICLTASAGQIRTKKTVFIKESILLEYQNTLMCGLSVDIINQHGGVNINKFLAYLALCNSATDVWEDFDITKTIVVDDMETVVNGLVDFIDDITYKIDRKNMDILISHTDGCGIMLPKFKKNKMTRLPWIKGLLGIFAFNTFIKKANQNNPEKNHGLIKDIYGVEHDILAEGIEVIFTKSQFKMWKYYDSWEQYIQNYIKYNCTAGKCNEEEDKFGYAKLNYQMLQTLTDMTEQELSTIANRTKNTIVNIASDRKTMLKVFGVMDSNTNKNHLQQGLEIYPELLSDVYTKETLKQIKKSLVKDARAGKLDINGRYTFILPDLYAFCEYLFLGNKNPKGLLKDGEVFCKLYKNSPKLDCLRSPHLYREHAVRNNVIDKEKLKWFNTYGLYTSCHDLISKILQFDVDGDKSLVCADKTIIEVSERNMKEIVPLYYNMKKAEAEIVSPKSIYEGLKSAYTGGNIGLYSNDISKIWNSYDIDLDIIKILCMENNFVIDYAKTLYKPDRPSEIKSKIIKHTNVKTPHFFIYAKDKHKDKVEKINSSVVNKLNKIIPNKRINFNAANLGKFNYKILMSNPNIDIDENIVNKYNELNIKNYFNMNKEDDEINNYSFMYKDIKEQILNTNNNLIYVVDVLVKHLYKIKKSKYKTTLWECFGDVIVENIRDNVKENTILCEVCGKRVDKNSESQKYCDDCFEIHRREYKTKKQQEYRKKIKTVDK